MLALSFQVSDPPWSRARVFIQRLFFWSNPDPRCTWTCAHTQGSKSSCRRCNRLYGGSLVGDRSSFFKWDPGVGTFYQFPVMVLREQDKSTGTFTASGWNIIHENPRKTGCFFFKHLGDVSPTGITELRVNWITRQIKKNKEIKIKWNDRGGGERLRLIIKFSLSNTIHEKTSTVFVFFLCGLLEGW